MVSDTEAGTRPRDVHLVRVFTDGPGGGNPAPTIVDARGLTDEAMRGVAGAYGHESGFVLPASPDSGCDYRFRYFVPNHEMEMCGHATVGAVWLLDHLGQVSADRIAIATLSGVVEARIARDGAHRDVEISQPAGIVEAVPPADVADILSVLGIDADALAPHPIQNARTSRVKTLIPLASVAVLDALVPAFDRIEAVCERIGSTGLYPYAVSGERMVDARQFPKSSGYPEDAATGIAAAALAFGLLDTGQVEAIDAPVTIRQGRAMGCASRIQVRFRRGPDGIDGCWLGGRVELERVDAVS